MTDVSSVAPSATDMIAKQANQLNKAAGAAATSFSDTLSKVQNAIIKPKTGFTAGPTYEANTLTGRATAALSNTISNTINVTKAALHIKP
jgi:hypothetical protein